MNILPDCRKLISDYLIAVRNRGAFLPYSDYAIIDGWLTHAEDVDELLLILDDIVPHAFGSIPASSPPPSLKMIEKRVNKVLRERLMGAEPCIDKRE